MGERPKLDADLTRSLVIGGVCVAGALGMLVGHARTPKRPAPVPVAAILPRGDEAQDFGFSTRSTPRPNDIPPVPLGGSGAGGRAGPAIAFAGSSVAPAEGLPAEVVNRIVRQGYGRYRLCYENGLRGNPTLRGRIGVKFVIGRDGSVAQTAEESDATTLRSREVVACVVRGFAFLSFPSPGTGVARVTYRIDFTP